jgi:hypothetical protein
MEARRKVVAPAPPEPEPVQHFIPDEEPRFPTPAELEARSGEADPANADISGLPERLRRKIEDDIAREERGHHTAPILLAAVAVVAIALGLVIAQRFQVIDLPFLRPLAGLPSETKPAPVPVAAVVPPPVAVTPPLDSTRTTTDSTAAAHDSTLAAHAAVPANATAPVPVSAAPKPAPATSAPVASAAPAKPKPAAPAATTAPPVATPKPATPAMEPSAALTPATPAARPDTLVYGIGVASYLDRDRALQELNRLTALSQLPGQIVPFNSSGTTMFRVVLGRYASNGSATRAASDFVAKYGVSEAQPLLLSRRRAR